MDMLRRLFAVGIVDLDGSSRALTLASWVSSAVVTGTSFLFVLRLTHSRLAATGAALLLQVTPVVWYGSVYGFPTMVSMALLLTACLLLGRALESTRAISLFGALAFAFVLYALAVATKFDMILAAPMFGVPIWEHRRGRQRVLWCCGVAVATALGFLVCNWYASSLVPAAAARADFERFGVRFFAGPGYALTWLNLRIVAGAVGVMSAPLAVIAIAVLFRNREWRARVLWLLCAGLPTTVFWSMVLGNSARHNLVAGLFLCVLLALPLATSSRRPWAGLLVLMAMVNYFYYPASQDSVALSGRLVASTELMGAFMASLQQASREVSRLPYEKVAVVGLGWTHPYIRHEAMKYGRYVEDKLEDDALTLVVSRGGHQRSLLTMYEVPPSPVLENLARQGYFLVVADPRSAEMFAPIHSILGGWAQLRQDPLPNPGFQLLLSSGGVLQGP